MWFARETRDRIVVGALVIVAASIAAGYGGFRWNEKQQQQHDRVVGLTHGGDPDRGRDAVVRYGCGQCHTVSSIRNAKGLVGPPLDGIAKRVYIGGVMPNTPDAMIAWIQDPPAIDQKTAMPNTGVTPEDARDIAAFLYTLR